MNNLRIKVSAIAKDEAAYLPEWIFHHLHFGFDHLEIIINRTKDNSLDILNKIQNQHSNVTYRNFDWLDLCPESVQRSIQYIAYADAFARAKAEGYTHIFFLDIDELWTPLNFETPIQTFLTNNECDASYSFHWNCELGLASSFSSLQNCLKYFPNDHVKTLINLNSPVQQIKIHAPLFSKDAKHRLADGSTFVSRDSQGQFSNSDFFKNPDIPAFVIHRMYRSEIEYISSLLRGNPNSNENIGSLFKDNRHGFKTSSATLSTIAFPPKPYQFYAENYLKFLSECGIAEDLILARSYVYLRAEQAISAAAELTALDPKRAEKIFSGCTNRKITSLFQFPTDNLRYKIDSVTTLDKGIKVLGWAISNQPNMPVIFETSNSDWTLNLELVDRPDVDALFPGNTQKSGFKAIIESKLSPNDIKNTDGALSISLPAKIKTYHDSHLYYHSKSQKFEHIPNDKPANSMGKFPVFFTSTKSGEALAVYLEGTIKVCCANQNGAIQLVNLNNLEEQDNIITRYEQHDAKFSLTVKNRFLSAIKDGPIALDRIEAKAWETFSTEVAPTEMVMLEKA